MIIVDTSPDFRFGRFTLEPDRRVLRAGDDVVPLGARAFDMLLLLVRNRDRVVSKDEILASVWSGRLVEENNLAVHVSALRRALGEKAGGDRFIATVSGIGYRFVGAVEEARSWKSPTALIGVPEGKEAAQGVPDGTSETEPAAIRRGPRRRAWIAVCILSSALLLSVAGWRLIRWASSSGPPPLSIAVVPFRDLDGTHPSFADAVTDDLTADLSFVPGSVVIARDSTERFRESQAGAAEIGRLLKVRYLVEGSLLADGSKLHVDTELVDTQTERQLWASMFDVQKTDVADRLQEVVRRVSSVLRVTLVDTAASNETRPHDDPDALDLLWQARSVLDRRGDYEAYVEAQGLLERAVAIAPHDGDVLAELGLVLAHKMGDFNDPDEAADYNQAVSVTHQALMLVPNEAFPSTSAGLLAWVDYRYREAQAQFRTALTIDPNELDALEGLALCARQLAHFDEMITDLKALMLIDPIGPRSAPREVWIGMGYLLDHQPNVALDWLRRAATAERVPGGGGSELGWQDWRRLFVIAATEISGDHAAAKRLYADLNRERPHLTVFQLAHYASRAMEATSGQAAYLDALRRAGMPLYPREDEDDGVPMVSVRSEHADFDPTPTSVEGAQTVTAATVRSLMTGPVKPIVLDLSVGASVIPGALWLSPDDQSMDLLKVLAAKSVQQSDDRTIITMSYSPFGWQSFNAALCLVQNGFHHVLWFRGGEAAWAAAGLPLQDRRSS